MKTAFLVILFVLGSSPLYANFTHCSERVTKIHIHKNGNIYFNTDKTCSSRWCMINWPDPKQIDRVYSAMLLAIKSKEPLTFTWPKAQLDNCNMVHEVSYRTPEWIDVR